MIMKISAIVLIAVIAGVAVTGVLGFSMIPWLRKLKFGGTVLDSKDNKLAVPTMGGLMIIIGTCFAILLAVALVYWQNGCKFMSSVYTL